MQQKKACYPRICHRVLQGGPLRGRQLYFTFPSAPDLLFRASKPPFLTLALEFVHRYFLRVIRTWLSSGRTANVAEKTISKKMQRMPTRWSCKRLCERRETDFFFNLQLCTPLRTITKLGYKIQGPSWGQQKRRKPLFGTFWTDVLSGLRWLKVA